MTNSRAAQQEAQDRALRRPGMSAKNRANVLMGAIGVWLLISWHLAVWITSRGMAFTDVGASWGTLLRYLLDTLLGGLTGNEDAPSSPLDLGPGIDAGNPVLVGIVLVVLLAVPVVGLVIRATRTQRRRVTREGRDGMVASDALQRRLQGPKGLAAAAPLQPSARYEGRDIRFRAEDTVSCAAIPRQGKSAYLTIGEVIDAPGAVITTSTKVDVFRLTAHARSQRGSVWLFDPEGVSLWPERAHWNVVSGCEAAKVAMDRSRSMAAAMPLGDRNQFFEEAAGTVLRCLLHAAALSGATMREVVRWAMDFDDDTPYNVLTRHPEAIPGWVNDLRTYCRGSAGETVSNTQMSLQLVLKPLADPNVLAIVCPPTEDGQGRLFDSAAFLESTDALYLLSEGGSSGAAPLLTALLGDVIRVARTKSQRTAAGRLDPPLMFSLDEFVNIAPVPDAPSLASDGGGRGLATRFYYQDYSQIEKRYGREGAQTIWTASSAKMLMGGSANDAQLESVSRLLGDRDVTRTSRTFTESDDLPNYSVTQQRERKFTISDLREIPEGKALLMYRDQPGAIVDLIPWWERRDADKLRKGQQWVLEREGLGSEHA